MEYAFDPARFTPFADNVLVRLDRTQDLRSQPGLVQLVASVSGADVAECLIGTVVSVGPGYYPDLRLKPERPREDERQGDRSPRVSAGHLIATTVKPGERVLLETKFSGDEVSDASGERYRICRECQLAAVVEP